MESLDIPPRILEGDFAGWLRDAMTARGMSARMVGMRTGINHSTVTRLMHGERQPTLATAMGLLRLLGSEPMHDSISNGSPSKRWPPDLSLL